MSPPAVTWPNTLSHALMRSFPRTCCKREENRPHQVTDRAEGSNQEVKHVAATRKAKADRPERLRAASEPVAPMSEPVRARARDNDGAAANPVWGAAARLLTRRKSRSSATVLEADYLIRSRCRRATIAACVLSEGKPRAASGFTTTHSSAVRLDHPVRPTVCRRDRDPQSK